MWLPTGFCLVLYLCCTDDVRNRHVKPIVRGMDFGKLELTLSRLWQTSRWSWLVTNPSLNALFLGRQEKARCTQIIQANIDIAIKAHVNYCMSIQSINDHLHVRLLQKVSEKNNIAW